MIIEDAIASKIHFIRDQKVMLDSDLAELYGVETKRLKEQVRRNMDRFPDRFMFELTQKEDSLLRSQIATSKEGRGGTRYLSYAFTEHGVLMLANVLKSKQAIDMSIRIIDVFVRMRELALAHKDIMLQIKKLEKTVTGNTEDIKAIFNYLNELLNPVTTERVKIGYKVNEGKEDTAKGKKPTKRILQEF